MFCRRLAGHFVRACALVGFLLFAQPARAADAPRAFDVSAGDAADTIKLVARQAGLEIVFFVETVRGIRTAALHGEFRPREALDRLVAGTGLAIHADERDGTLTVRRVEPAAGMSPPPTAPPSMKTKNPLAALGTWLALALAPAHLVSGAEPTKTADETVVLTPFTVDATRDVGFVAASALAGGRLATDLKDTPVAYSVLTREFIDALNLTNVVDAAAWTPNSSYAMDDGRSNQFGDAGFYTRTNFRGVAASQPQINFFPAYYDYDSYNLQRYDFARGPNSVLFGSGSNGGSANALYKDAETRKATRELQVRLGSWNNYRATLDVNQPITKELAVRGNLLWQDRETWRDREWEKKIAGSVHVSYAPWANTRVRAIADKGTVRNNLGLTTLGDRISGWDGVTVFNGAVTAAPANTTGTVRNGSPTAPYYVVTPGLAPGSVINWANTAATQSGGQNTGTPIGGQAIVGPSINQDQNPIIYANGLPANFLSTAVNGARFNTPGRKFAPVSDDEGYRNNYGNYILSVDQKVSEHLFLTAGTNFSSGYRGTNYIIVRGLNNIFLDVNRTLPTGGANPNFLQPYLESTRDFDDVNTRSNNYRASAAVVYDKTNWGDFRLNLEVGRNHFKTLRNKYRYAVKDTNVDSRLWVPSTLARWRYYLNEANRPLNELPTASVVDPIAGTTRTLPTGYVLDVTRADQTVRTKNDFDYGQAAFTGKLFKGRLNLMAAARRDKWESNNLFSDFAMDLPAGWNGSAIIYKPTGPANYFGLRYTPKNAAGVATGAATDATARPRDAAGLPQPQYANDVFQDDFSPPTLKGRTPTYSYGAVFHLTNWASVFANHAETWSPPGSNLRINYSVFVPVTSEGWDAGLRFNFLNSRLNLAVTRYGSTQENLSQSTGTGSAGLAVSLPNAINGLLDANAIGDLTPSGRNRRGINGVPTTYVDTTKRKTKGTEFELTANPITGLRVMANIAFADAKQLDGFADTRAYLAANDTVLKQVLADAGVTVGANNVATVNAGVTTDTSPDAPAAAANWNALQGAAANLTPAAQKVSRLAEVTGNVFTDYTIQAGRLKGLRVGGGVNYRGREVIGFRGADTIVNPANPATAIDDPNVDALNAVYRGGYSTFTAVAGYSFKFRQRFPVRIDLTVSNLFNKDTPLYYNTAQRPVGGNITSPARVATPNQYFYLVPRAFSLATTVGF